jgi:heme exporter protein B
MLRSLLILVNKEFTIELRKKSVIAGIGLYLISLIFISYLAFNFGQAPVSVVTWAALFWLTLLFSVINTVAKSFIGEKKGVAIYQYSIVSAREIILSKILYNTLLCLFLSLAALLLFQLFLPTPPDIDYGLFVVALILTSLGFSACLSLISAISSKTNNSSVIMAVLSFPVVISILLMAIQITKNVLDQLDVSASTDELLNLLAINCILTGLAYLLFPYIWRS